MFNRTHSQKTIEIERDSIVAKTKHTVVKILNVGLHETSQYVTNRGFVTCVQPKCGKHISGEDNTYIYIYIRSVILPATFRNTNGDITRFCVH